MLNLKGCYQCFSDSRSCAQGRQGQTPAHLHFYERNCGTLCTKGWHKVHYKLVGLQLIPGPQHNFKTQFSQKRPHLTLRYLICS